jgi:6-phosphogluconolactonase (cycloisomerase 2 family)
MAVDAAYSNLYVANAGSNSIVHFDIGVNSGLTLEKDTAAPSTTPVAIAVNTADTYLYVLSGTTSARLTVYPLASGVIGTPLVNATTSNSYWPIVVPGHTGDVMIPTGVTVLANSSAVYVTAWDQSAYNPGCTPYPACITSTANPGWVFGFTVGANGALTPVAGSPFEAGVQASAIASDPTNRFVYVTDFASNGLIAYTIQDGSTLAFLHNGPFNTGKEPSAIVIDPRGRFIYVTNYLDSTVSAYAIDLPTGTPTTVVNTTGSLSNATLAQPVAVVVDPALGSFVYTANNFDSSVSGFHLNTTSGALSPTQSTPYPTGAKPTALVAIPHGNHATQVVGSTTP